MILLIVTTNVLEINNVFAEMSIYGHFAEIVKNKAD